jgi:hypothetical protein
MFAQLGLGPDGKPIRWKIQRVFIERPHPPYTSYDEMRRAGVEPRRYVIEDGQRRDLDEEKPPAPPGDDPPSG